MKIFKVLPNSYVYPGVLLNAGLLSVISRAIKTNNDYWEFNEKEYALVEYKDILGLEKYGTGATGVYYWVRLPKLTMVKLDTNAARYTGTPFIEEFKVYGFYVHCSRVKTIDGNDVYNEEDIMRYNIFAP